MSENQYKYKNTSLTASIASFIIPLLFDGQTVERDFISRGVSNFHKNNGGLDPSGLLSNVIKKSLSDLNKLGVSEKIRRGVWRINKAPNELPVIENINLPKVVELDDSTKVVAEKIIGFGSGSVYVYYYPVYKLNALQGQEKYWLCKIGRSDSCPVDRVTSQVGTAIPERPVVALVLKTDNAIILESSIHSILKLRSRWSNSSPGSEWFKTNPDEVESIFSFIVES